MTLGAGGDLDQIKEKVNILIYLAGHPHQEQKGIHLGLPS
jgi:hypothetical protein